MDIHLKFAVLDPALKISDTHELDIKPIVNCGSEHRVLCHIFGINVAVMDALTDIEVALGKAYSVYALCRSRNTDGRNLTKSSAMLFGKGDQIFYAVGVVFR